LPEVQQHLLSGSTCGGIHSEKRKGRKSQFLFTAQLLRQMNLAEIFSESRSGTIAHKNKTRFTRRDNTNGYWPDKHHGEQEFFGNNVNLLNCAHWLPGTTGGRAYDQALSITRGQ
jgi:hypothetical protein